MSIYELATHFQVARLLREKHLNQIKAAGSNSTRDISVEGAKTTTCRNARAFRKGIQRRVRNLSSILKSRFFCSFECANIARFLCIIQAVSELKRSHLCQTTRGKVVQLDMSFVNKLNIQNHRQRIDHLHCH
jgi:negative regulator of replication initiation